MGLTKNQRRKIRIALENKGAIETRFRMSNGKLTFITKWGLHAGFISISQMVEEVLKEHGLKLVIFTGSMWSVGGEIEKLDLSTVAGEIKNDFDQIDEILKEPKTIATLARDMNMKAYDILKSLHRVGPGYYGITLNQPLTDQQADEICAYFGHLWPKHKEPELVPKLKPWQVRLIAEHDDLYARTNRLMSFMKSRAYDELPYEDQQLLGQQLKAMGQLGRVLFDRMARHKLVIYSDVGGPLAMAKTWL